MWVRQRKNHALELAERVRAEENTDSGFIYYFDPYTYTAQGNPLTVTAPADAAGVQPQTTYGYTAYTASGYPTFYLQTSQSSKITATSTVVTTTTYNAANKDNRGQTTVFSRCPCPSAGCRWAHLSREQLREVVEVV